MDERFNHYNAAHLRSSHPLHKIYLELSNAEQKGLLTMEMAEVLEGQVCQFGEEKKQEAKQVRRQLAHDIFA